MKLVQESPYRFRIDARDGMRVPGIVFASRELLPDGGADMALNQIANECGSGSATLGPPVRVRPVPSDTGELEHGV
ncbi:MAG TPA: hypothetical protein DGG94_23150 [Micromonosporaceae bacterium]|nr:hypothetical protein [Micromonosporaceae bacterium]HCU52649.1 hypothetical protein [Micromonosporaceae bacterium]